MRKVVYARSARHGIAEFAHIVAAQVLATFCKGTEVAVVVPNTAIIPSIYAIVVSVLFVVANEVILKNDIPGRVDEHNPVTQIVPGSVSCYCIVVAPDDEYAIGVVTCIVILDDIVVRKHLYSCFF